MKTTLDIRNERFFINDRPTYADIPGVDPAVCGLLMNARFIQGIFDDRSGREKYHRFGRTFDPDANTDALIAALPQWYHTGLRGFTVGFQGGGPCFTVDVPSIENNPFGPDGRHLDNQYAQRMDRLIRAADALGMVVIVSFFYGAQALRLEDGRAVRSAISTASRFLREGGYTNVIIEVANERNIGLYKKHPLLYEEDGMVWCIDLARDESGGLPVGCSDWGGSLGAQIARASDVILIHGNSCSRQSDANLVAQARTCAPGKPVVCNEDSPAIGQLPVAFHTRSSWGYYNNLTKQEPPADWSITPGEDQFFALRLAEGLGIPAPLPEPADRYRFMGCGHHEDWQGKRWPRLAALYPEQINAVTFYRNGEMVSRCYDEPFMVNYKTNWLQGPWERNAPGDRWEAHIALRDGDTIVKEAVIPE